MSHSQRGTWKIMKICWAVGQGKNRRHMTNYVKQLVQAAADSFCSSSTSDLNIPNKCSSTALTICTMTVMQNGHHQSEASNQFHGRIQRQHTKNEMPKHCYLPGQVTNPSPQRFATLLALPFTNVCPMTGWIT